MPRLRKVTGPRYMRTAARAQRQPGLQATIGSENCASQLVGAKRLQSREARAILTMRMGRTSLR